MKEILKGIKNIIFDLGEVIVDLDIAATEKAFASFVANPKESIYTLKGQTRIFDLLEVGKITPAEFRSELNNLSHQENSDEILDAAWNAMLIQIPSRKIQLVQNLRSTYQTFVLSNTNKIHIDYVEQHLLPAHQLKTLDEIFDFVYYSHEIGERKPDAAAYQFILNKHELIPFETLFIDDKLENILAAKELGIKTWHLTNREDLYELA
jgi:putative hydrolase of the HAD superfamily